MKNIHFLLTVGVLAMLGTNCAFGQGLKVILPNELGINFFTQRTQTIMQSEAKTPYFNTYGYNKGFGLSTGYQIKEKWSLKLFYNYANLINTYDPISLNPLFFPKDIKKFKPFSLYWISHEIGLGFKYKILSKKGNTLSFEESLCTNFGQLVYGNAPSSLGDTLTKAVVYQNGRPVNLNYQIYQISVRNMGLNMLTGICYDRVLTSRLNIQLNLSFNFGFVPLIGTKIVSSLSETDTINPYYDYNEYNTLSSNSGVRFGVGLNYIIKKNN